MRELACSAPFFPVEKTRGAVDKFVDALYELQAAGLSWFNVGIPTDSRAVYFENLAWLNEEVLPRFPE